MRFRPILLAAAFVSAGLFAVAAGLAPPPAHAQGKGNAYGKDKPGKGNNGKPGKSHNKGQKKWQAKGRFETREIDVIRNYFGRYPYRSYYGSSPRPLPPGMRNRLAQGKPLPPGIAKRQLPPRLLQTLPYRPGYRYYAIGTDVVLVGIATNIVIDIAIGLLR